MSASDELDLELTSDPDALPDVREKLRAWVLSRGWADDQVAEIVLAVDEALSNVIRHGYGSEKTHKILLKAQSIRDPQAGPGVEIRVRDFGRQVDPDEIRGRDLDEVRPGGLGVHLIRSLMSSAEYARAAGGGMLLVMRKYKRRAVCGKKR